MLDSKNVEIREERHSRKAPLSDAEARRLLDSVSEVILWRGKTSRRLSRKNATVDDLRGATGAFRAPMVRNGKTLLVGFNEKELERLIG